MKSGLWIDPGQQSRSAKPGGALKIRFRATNGVRWPEILAPEKGRPPPGGGGGGRRVSAPGGRADTPRHKPSNAHYTHGTAKTRKRHCCRLPTVIPASASERMCRELPFYVAARLTRRSCLLCWRCDRFRWGCRGIDRTAIRATHPTASTHRSLLRPRQDRHRQVQHACFQQTVLQSGFAESADGPQVDICPVSVPDVRRRPRPDGPHAQLHHQHVHRLGRRTSQIDRRRNLARHRRPAGVRRSRRADRRPQAVRPRRRGGVGFGRGDRRADRQGARRHPRHGHPDGGRGGGYTGEIAFYCYGEGKVEAIRALAAREGYALDHRYAHSDSVTDIPMLENVGHPTAVNPDRGLRKEAASRGWPVLTFTTAGVVAGPRFRRRQELRSRPPRPSESAPWQPAHRRIRCCAASLRRPSARSS